MEQKVILFHGNYWAMFLQSQREEQKPAKPDISSCASEMKLAWNHFVSVSFNLQSPAIHQRLVGEPELLLKAEDTGGSKRILEGYEEYTSPTNCFKREMTTFAKSWNSCSDTGSSPMLVITWGTIQIWIQKMTKTMDILIIFWQYKLNWFSYLSKFVHGEFAVFIPEGRNMKYACLRVIPGIKRKKWAITHWRVLLNNQSLCSLIKLLECFQEFPLALGWPPFQTQSHHLDKTIKYYLRSPWSQ